MAILKSRHSTPINIKFPLKKSYSGAFQTNDTTIEAYKDNIKVLLLTNYGERVNSYDYGANLRPIIFEQEIDDIKDKITASIVAAIDKWIPEVTINNIVITLSKEDASLNNNEIKVSVDFFLGQTSLDGNVTLNIR